MINGKQIFVLGLFCFAPAFLMFKLGQQEIRQAAEYEINPEKITRQLEPGQQVPTHRDGIIHYCWSGLWTTIGTLSVLYTFFVHLDILGRRTPTASLSYDIRTVARDRWKSKELALMDDEASGYAPFGFKPIGYVEEKYANSTKRRALHLSPDGTRLLSISASGNRATSTMTGVWANGVCYSLGVGSDTMIIEGLEHGIPLSIRNFPAITPEQMMEGFDKFWGVGTENKHPLAVIDPACAPALIHYRSLLVRWFSLIAGHSHETPDDLPETNELIQMRNGVATFCWGAVEPQTLEPVAV